MWPPDTAATAKTGHRNPGPRRRGAAPCRPPTSTTAPPATRRSRRDARLDRGRHGRRRRRGRRRGGGRAGGGRSGGARLRGRDQPMNGERWLPVLGHPGYEVSDAGRVRSPHGLLAAGPGGDGYPYVSLGRDCQVKVHTLVLTTFVGPRPPDMECRHLDDNPLNAALTNLRWGTRSENILDRVRLGNHYEAARATCPLDHLLVAPNLVPSCLPRRGCLACSRGSSAVRNARRRHGITLDLRVEADRRYEWIMAS